MRNSHKPQILLHVCCAPCAGYVIQELEKPASVETRHCLVSTEAGFSVTPFFYNPNIHPEQEYEKRLGEIKKFMGDKLLVDDYDVDNWFGAIKGLETEPEKGRRCDICYRLRLEKTAQVAKDEGFDYFASTLTISPHKKADVINQIGLELAEKYGVKFLAVDWKKKDGFKKSCDLAREHNFYRQDYCGCVYSKVS